jgi:hypothetical protein
MDLLVERLQHMQRLRNSLLQQHPLLALNRERLSWMQHVHNEAVAEAAAAVAEARDRADLKSLEVDPVEVESEAPESPSPSSPIPAHSGHSNVIASAQNNGPVPEEDGPDHVLPVSPITIFEVRGMRHENTFSWAGDFGPYKWIGSCLEITLIETYCLNRNWVISANKSLRVPDNAVELYSVHIYKTLYRTLRVHRILYAH